MPGLNDLMQEIGAGVEIFYTGRFSTTYFNTAYILCDDYTELTAKLFLLTDNPAWSDKRANNSFKNYHNVLTELEDVIRVNRNADLPAVKAIHSAMKARRERRNQFFHSTSLLDLTIRANLCIDAFCDLMAYGRLLFGASWDAALEQVANLDTLEIILRLEKCAAADPAKAHAYQRLFDLFDKQIPKPTKSTSYKSCVNADFHFRLIVMHGSGTLKSQLKALLPP